MIGPVFILSCPRSGSTLLRTLITRHSKISIPHEFPLLATVVEAASISSDNLVGFVDGLYSHKHFVEWDIPREALLDELAKSASLDKATIIETVYSFFLDPHISNKAMWGEKNIGNLALVEEIKSLFPSARLIFLVRDPIDIAHSLSKRKWRFYQFSGRRKWCLKSIVGITGLLRDGFSIIKKYSSQREGIIVRYEDLVDNSERVLMQVCDYIGVDFEDQMLDTQAVTLHHRLGISTQRLQSDHENVFKPIISTRQRVKSGKSLSPEHLSFLHNYLNVDVERFGYRSTDTQSSSIYALWTKLCYRLIYFSNWLIIQAGKILKCIFR